MSSGGKIIDSTSLSQEGKDAVKSIGQTLINKIPSFSGSGGSGPSSKPISSSMSSKPIASLPGDKPFKISRWDKFKNFFAGISNKILAPMGVPEAHIISEKDYVNDPQTGKYKFDWDTANKNFKEQNGRDR